MISITINNIEYDVRANASVLQACEEVGVDIPRFCYHEKLSVAGNCRMCLVEVQKAPKPIVSCAMPVSKGMVIFTETPLVKKAREGVIEFLLANHPLDCPICDQGGECDLQDESLQFGSDRGRKFEFKRSVEDKDCGPIIKTIMTRCIHCTRCARFTTEIVGQEILGAFGRGQEMEIGTYAQSFVNTELSGNLVDLCPVGALTSKPYAFKARNWELRKVETVDFFDSMCADIVVQKGRMKDIVVNKEELSEEHEEIVRILPKNTDNIMDNWISDRTRYAFDGLKKNRLSNVEKKNIAVLTASKGSTQDIEETKSSMVKGMSALLDLLEVNSYHAMNAIDGAEVRAANRIGAVVGPYIDAESLYFLAQYLKAMGSKDIQYGNYDLKMNIDLSSFYSFNLTKQILENLGCLFIVGHNPRYEVSIFNSFLRKQQNRYALTYTTLGAFVDLRLKQQHIGNGLRSLWSLAENRENLIKKALKVENSSFFFGVESLKLKSGFLVLNVLRYLGRKFYLKNKKGERLSFLHSSVSTISFAQMGIQKGARSTLYFSKTKSKDFSLLFNIQNTELFKTKWLNNSERKTEMFYTNVVSFSTHKERLYDGRKISSDILIPIKSMYEKDGFLFNFEGKLRSFNKVITAPKNIVSLKLFFASFLRCHSYGQWRECLEKFWNFEEHFDIAYILERENVPFFFNTFLFTENENRSNLFLFSSTANSINFYMKDVITSNSKTMAECALFLGKEKNF